MGKNTRFFKSKEADMGIGAMIIFIAMVLVAGIAASVFINVANTLQMQALYTGYETIDEVATGIAVLDIEGGVDANSTTLDKLTLTVRGRAGSGDIDLGKTVIELATNETKVVLTYNSTCFVAAPDAAGIFQTSAAFGMNGSYFGIIPIMDADSSVSRNTEIPIINKGDAVLLTINLTAAFGGVPERIDVWGSVIPEFGSWGVITFRTPTTYTVSVYDLM